MLNGVKIDTASKYFQHAYKVKRDPTPAITKPRNFYEKVGIEHPGQAVARALIFDDNCNFKAGNWDATMPDTNTIAGNDLRCVCNRRP